MNVVLNEDWLPVTEKAFALSVYYRTLRQVLPERPYHHEFTAEQVELLTKLLAFLSAQSPPNAASLQAEIKVVTDLTAFQ
jgi:hypothetical protein